MNVVLIVGKLRDITYVCVESPIIRTLVKFREAVVASSKKCSKLSVMSLLLLLSILGFSLQHPTLHY